MKKYFIIAGLVLTIALMGLIGLSQAGTAQERISGDLAQATEFLQSVTVENLPVAEKLLGALFPALEDVLAASGTRFPNGISADSTSPSAGQVRGTTLTTTGAATIGGAATFSSTSQFNGAITASTTVDVETFSEGGGVTATTTGAASKLALAEIDTENYYQMLPTAAFTLTTLASSSYATLMPSYPGSSRTIRIKNAKKQGNPAYKITFAAGSGVSINTASSSPNATLQNGDVAKTIWTRTASDTIEILWIPGQ